MITQRGLVAVWMAIAILASSGASSLAAPVALVNADFETDAAADPDGSTPDKTGWGAANDGFGAFTQGTLDPGIGGGAIFAGENNYLQAQARGNAGGPLGGVSFAGGSQIVPTTIMANRRYTLSLDVASQSPNAFPTNVPADDVYPAGFNGGNPIMLVRLVNMDGGSIGFGETTGVTLVSNSPIPANGASTTWTREYVTDAAPANLGGGLFIQLFVQSNSAGGLQEALFDNVSLDVSPIPEPGSIALLGFGGMVMTALRRRRAAGRKFSPRSAP